MLLRSLSSESIAYNLFHALPTRRTIQDINKRHTGLGSNDAVPSFESNLLPDNVDLMPSVFTDPINFDFRHSADLPPCVPSTTTKYYGADAAYVNELKRRILSTWPAPIPTDTIPDNLNLEDP